MHKKFISIPAFWYLLFLAVLLPSAALASDSQLPPSAILTLTGPSTICPGDSTSFRVQITDGSAPYVITYAIDGVPQPPVTTNANPYDFNLIFTQSGLIELIAIEAAGEAGSVSGSVNVTVADGPTATISGGGQICQGGNGTTISVTFTGTGPYTFIYTADNVPEPPVTTSANPHVINVNPSSGTIYRLQSVSSPTCTGIVSGTAIVFVFTPSTARLQGDSTFCNSALTTLPVDFTGTGPFNLVYAINGIPQDTVETFDDPFMIPVDIDSTTTYTLVSVQSPGCFGSVIGSATVTINYPPTYNNVQLLCNPATNSYTVEFDVLNATPPLSLVSGAGTFIGNRFISAPLPQAQDYSFVFRDSLNCGNITVSGPTICNCVSAPGVMDSILLNACPGDSITANFLGGAVLDNDDSLRFILHTLPGFPVGHIIAWNDTPGFVLSDTLLTDSTYYISAVAGNFINGDTIDLNDFCLKVSPGTPVFLHAPPSAALSGDTTVCAGANLSLPVNLNGTAPFTLQYSFAGQAAVTESGIAASPFQLMLTPAGGGDFVLLSVQDSFCSSIVSDTVRVSIHPTPQIDSIEIVCNFNNSTYQLEFNATGGTAPYTVNGVAGSFSGNRFTSVPISNTLPYSISLSDVYNCGQATAAGMAVCICPTSAGTMSSSSLIKLCPGDNVAVAHNGDQTLDLGDIFQFVLHTLPGSTLGTVLATNSTPSFNFINGQTQLGVTYYISAVAGNDNGNGQIDLNDPCLSVAPGTPVRWNAAPTATIGGNFDVCPGQQQLLGIQFTGQGPYTFTYTQNGSPTTAIAPQNNFAINTSLLQTTTIQLVSVTDANCPGTVSGQAIITVHPTPQLSNLQIVCNPDNLTYFIEFDVIAGDLPTMVFSGNVPGNYNSLTGHFTGNSLPLATPFTIIGRDVWQCGADTLSGTETCNCTSFAGQISGNALDVCAGAPVVVPAAAGFNFDGNDVLGYILYEAPLVLPQGVLAYSSQPDFGAVAGLQAGKTYLVSAVVGNQNMSGNVNLGDPCLSISNGIPVNIRAIPTATINGDTTVCVGSNYLFPVVFTGNAPYQFSYSVNGGLPQPPIVAPQNSFLISLNNIQQTQVITLSSLQDKYCPGTVTGTVSIDVRLAPEIQLSGGGRICPGDSALLLINLVNTDSCTVNVNSNAGNLVLNDVSNGFSFSVSPSSTTTYSLGAVTVWDNNCPLKSSGTAVIESNPMNVQINQSDYNGFGVSCDSAMDGRLEILSSGGFQPLAILWENNSNLSTRNGLRAGSYACTVTDAANCTATVTATLTEPEPIRFEFSVLDPTCFSNGEGAVVIESVDNATGMVSAQIDSQTPVLLGSLPQSISGLPGGSYQLTLEDDNGCLAVEAFTLDSSGGISVELGPDLVIFQYDSVLLTPLVNGGTVLRFNWSPATGLSDSLNFTPWASPTNSIQYRLTVEDANGCTASDAVMVRVDKTNRVYVPNAIKPSAAGDNSTLVVYAGPEVEAIRFMQVYDRWGNLMYEVKDIKPNDPSTGWDGNWRGKEVEPGVYVYVTEVQYRDGSTEVFSGDVAIIR